MNGMQTSFSSQLLQNLRKEMELLELQAKCFRGSYLMEGLHWSEDNMVFTISDCGVYVFKLNSSPKYLDSNTNFIQSTIRPSKNKYPTADVIEGLQSILRAETRENIFEMINDHVLTPKGSTINPEWNSLPIFFVQCLWCPLKLFPFNQSGLITVTNTGNVDLYFQAGLNWKSISNLTEIYLTKLKATWDMGSSSFQILKERVFSICTICVDVSPLIQLEDTFCFIVFAQRNRDLIFWKLSSFKNTKFVPPSLIKVQKTDGSSRITSMHWCSLGNNTVLILLGYLNGNIRGFHFKYANDSVELIGSTDFWTDEDLLRVGKITHENLSNGKTIILIVKEMFLVVYLVNGDGVSLSQIHHNFGNVKITDIQETNSLEYVITSYHSIINRTKIEIVEDCLKISVEEIKIPNSWSDYIIHGVCSSANLALFIVSASYQPITDNLLVKETLQFIICSSNLISLEDVIANNSIQKVNYFWDCLECFRLTCERYDYATNLIGNLNKYDLVSLYLLKIYYWINTVCENYYKRHTRPRHSANLTNPLNLRMLVLASHAIGRIEKLAVQSTVSKFQASSFQYLQAFLKSFWASEAFQTCCGPEMNEKISNCLKIELASASPPLVKCSFCETDIINDTCANGHVNDKCMVSFVPIDDMKFLTCKICKSTAHLQLLSDAESQFCTFCDAEIFALNYKDAGLDMRSVSEADLGA